MDDKYKIFDVFMGIMERDDRPLYYSSVNLKTMSVFYWNQDQSGAFDDFFSFFCHNIEKGKRILLLGKPEDITAYINVEQGDSYKGQIKDFVDHLNNNGCASIDKDSVFEDIVRIEPKTRFNIIAKNQLIALKEMYNKREDLKIYLNPFSYQPVLN